MRDLPTLLAEGSILHLPASVSHARRGALKNAFRYGADFVLTGPQSTRTLALLSRNRFNLFALYDRDNGGLRGQGSGAEWVWAHLARAGFQRTPDTIIGLMTQPRFLGYWFNPVSFWMIWKRGALCAVIAEVSNTFSQRHSYLCAHPDFRPIIATDTLRAEKIFHVSPFQDVSGHYLFRFDITNRAAAIFIQHRDGAEGLTARMTGPLRPATNRGLAAAALRRPGGAIRIVALIYWQALKLKLKGAIWRPMPPAPTEEVSALPGSAPSRQACPRATPPTGSSHLST